MVRTAATAYRMLHKLWVDAAPVLRAATRSSVARNAASLYVIQLANYVLPLITVPYLVRVLGPAGYGTVAFGQSFISYFALFVDYGFNLSATRKISIVRHDQATVSCIAVNVWAAKAFLSVLAFVLLLFLVGLISRLREATLLLLILYGTVVGNVFFPTWLFQGMERMAFISMANLVARCLVVVGTFALIRAPQDYLLYAGLTSAGSVAAGLIGVGLALRTFKLRLVYPSWRGVKQALAEGWVLFLSQASVSLYTAGNAFILGLLTSPAIVGYYSAAERIVKAVVGLLGPISQAAYPRLSRMAGESRDHVVQWGRRMLFLVGSIGIVLTLSLFVGAPVIVAIVLGSGFAGSVAAMRILALLPLLIGVSNVLGIQVMLPCGMDRQFTGILFAAGAINIGLAIIFAPLLQQAGMALAVLLSEGFVTITMFIYLAMQNLNPLSKGIVRIRPMGSRD